jgi:hypothetical protein
MWILDRNIFCLSTCHFLKLLCLFMNGMFTTESTIFFELELIRRSSFVLRRRIVPLFTLRTGQSQNVPH